jgi:hypothetical protein
MPESMHMIMWVLSDRAIPRSYRMMEGFGVHTFRFINEQGKAASSSSTGSRCSGVHSLVWDEAQKISGKDPDFHRRDLWEAIEMGDYPEWELGVQIVEEEDEHEFDFDLLDATKIIPEELVPVRRIGKMTLNRNPTTSSPRPSRWRSTRARRAGHRLHQRSAAAGAAVLVPRHAAHPPGRAELPRDPDQPAHGPGAQQPARRLHAADDQRVSFGRGHPPEWKIRDHIDSPCRSLHRRHRTAPILERGNESQGPRLANSASCHPVSSPNKSPPPRQGKEGHPVFFHILLQNS